MLLGKEKPGEAWGRHEATSFAVLFLKRATTAVEGMRATGAVRCHKGPNRIRGRWPPRWPPSACLLCGRC